MSNVAGQVLINATINQLLQNSRIMFKLDVVVWCRARIDVTISAVVTRFVDDKFVVLQRLQPQLFFCSVVN